MKRVFLLFIVQAMFFLTIFGQYMTTCNYEKAVPLYNGNCLPGDWVCVFEDEFNGTQIDYSKWMTHENGDRCRADWPHVFLDNNVSVNNGILSLLFKEQPGYYNCVGTTQWKQYSSGIIYSISSFLFGIFEAEIKIPNGTGFHPAFWLYGYGGEIDVFEFNDDETKPEFSTHRWPQSVHHRCTYTYNGVDYSADYHTYSVYWDPYFIACFIDGDLKFVHWLWYTVLGQSGIICHNLQAWHQYLFSKSFPSTVDEQNVIISFPAQVDHNPNPLPRELKVKYVRAWQLQEDICIDKTINQFATNNIKGKSITVDGNITVGPGGDITLTADSFIVLKSALHIQTGAAFKAEINPNLCIESDLKSTKVVAADPNINFSQIDSLKNISQNELIANYSDLVSIYPNPATNILNIYSEKTGKLHISDISGKVLYSTKIYDNITQIDMNTYKNGFYIVKLMLDNKVYIEKIIKQ
ncbi:MAG: family 16 glycosylhydrolase [Bacteroidales bacterium]|nr:family 16 glycosylhydrolase [Bacteroidales bacterium]